MDGLADDLADVSLNGLADVLADGSAHGLADDLVGGLLNSLTDGLIGAGDLLTCLRRRGHSYLYGDESKVLLLIISLLGHESVLYQREVVFLFFVSR